MWDSSLTARVFFKKISFWIKNKTESAQRFYWNSAVLRNTVETFAISLKNGNISIVFRGFWRKAYSLVTAQP